MLTESVLNEPSPGERLAAALRRSPIYVDPSLRSALPAADRRRLIAKFRKVPAPVYVILVPIVPGGTWTDAEDLATVVHDRLGRDGIFITLDDRTTSDLEAREWGGDHQARDAAWAVGLDRTMDDASLAERLDRITDLIISGKGTQEYRRISDEIRARAKKREQERELTAPKDDEGTGLALPLGAGAVAVAGVAGLLLWRQRRMAAAARSDGQGLLMPRTVFATARRANEDQLREQASHEVIHFGELLDESDIPTTNDEARTLMARALDAYQAAGKALDAAQGIPDLAGVLVLVDQGRDALASAQSVAHGKPEIPAMPLCFFNPLHGDATTKVDWRPLGSRKRLRVKTCQTCAKTVREKKTPDVLTDHQDGREIPYYEADPAKSVWAETGYGQLREDLIHRILRGDLSKKK